MNHPAGGYKTASPKEHFNVMRNIHSTIPNNTIIMNHPNAWSNNAHLITPQQQVHRLYLGFNTAQPILDASLCILWAHSAEWSDRFVFFVQLTWELSRTQHTHWLVYAHICSHIHTHTNTHTYRNTTIMNVLYGVFIKLIVRWCMCGPWKYLQLLHFVNSTID